MAQRRMFSNRIANSARFLQMPVESQLLYFHMILRADDDGIVESYPLMKLLGVAPDNFKVLLAKGFIRELNEDQVVLINDWKEHNVIRADRKIDSIYLPLLLAKVPDAEIVVPKPRSDVKNNSKRLSGPSTVSISQVRLGKVNNNNAVEKNNVEGIVDNSNSDVDNLVKESVKWAYRRSPNPPSCSEDSFERSVRKAIGQFGFKAVKKVFDREDNINAIQFLVNIKNL